LLDYKKYNRANSHLAKKIKPKNLIAFDYAEEAEKHGYKPGFYAKTRVVKETPKHE